MGRLFHKINQIHAGLELFYVVITFYALSKSIKKGGIVPLVRFC